MNKIGLTEEEELEQNKKIEAYEEAMEYKENHKGGNEE